MDEVSLFGETNDESLLLLQKLITIYNFSL